MTFFTVVGLVWFWVFCFEAGWFLAWASDSGGVVMVCARALVAIEGVDAGLHAMVSALSEKHTETPNG